MLLKKTRVQLVFLAKFIRLGKYWMNNNWIITSILEKWIDGVNKNFFFCYSKFFNYGINKKFPLFSCGFGY
jgi:hypothetical protein